VYEMKASKMMLSGSVRSIRKHTSIRSMRSMLAKR